MNYNDLSKQISDLTGNENQASQDQMKLLQGQYGYNDAYNNLQGVRRNVSDTQAALNALPEQLQQRTAGTLTTAGQLARLNTTEADPISKQLATLNQQQTLGQQGMSDIQNQINQGMGLWSQSYADRLSALQNQQSQAFQAQQAATSAANQRALIDYQNQLATKQQEAAQIAALKSQIDSATFTANSTNKTGVWELQQMLQNPNTNPAIKQYALDKMNQLSGGQIVYDINGNPIGGSVYNAPKSTSGGATKPTTNITMNNGGSSTKKYTGI